MEKRSDIQGLRAAAVLLVIAFHINSAFVPAGFVGVDIFFVISGFLMTLIIVSGVNNRSFSLPSFYWARAKRIVPAYMVLIGIVTAVMSILLVTKDFNLYQESAWAALWFGINIYFQQEADYFAVASSETPLLHLWSLAIEMQFYLFFPLLILALPKKILPFTLGAFAAALFILASLELQGEPGQSTYFALWARVPEFLVGSLAALFSLKKVISERLREPVGVLGLLLIIFTLYGVSDSSPFPGIYAIPVTLGTCLIIVAQPRALGKILKARPMQLIGDMSYSLYLWHWPVLATIRYATQSYELTAGQILYALTATWVLAYLSWKLIEQPLRQATFKPLGVLKVIAGPALASLTYLAGDGVNQIALVAQPVELTRYADHALICHNKVNDSCSRGSPDSDVHILLMGDSHAAQLNYFADEVGVPHDLHFTVITSSGCIPIEGQALQERRSENRGNCKTQAAEILDRIEYFDGVIIAGQWRRHAQNENFLVDLQDFLATLSALEVPVLVLGQIPEMVSDPQRGWRLNQLGITQNISTRIHGVEDGNDKIGSVTSGFSKVRFISFSNHPVFAKIPFHEGTIMYHDRHHLNEFGSRSYGRAVGVEIANWAISVSQSE